MKSYNSFSSSIEDNNKEHQNSTYLKLLYRKIDGVKLEADVPDGVYDVVIEGACLQTSQNSPPQFQWTLRINTGEYQNQIITRYDSLYHSPDSARLCRKDLYACGYPVENFNLLEDQGFCEQLIGIRIWILLVSKGNSKIYCVVRKL